MATRYYWSFICPPGIGKGPSNSWFFPTNSATQGGTIEPTFTYRPSAGLGTYTDFKMIPGAITDSRNFFVQNEYGSSKKLFNVLHQYYFMGGIDGVLVDDAGRVVQQATLVSQKDFGDNSTYPNTINANFPNYPGKSKKYAIKDTSAFPYTNKYRTWTYNANGLEYISATNTVASPSAMPLLGGSSWYSSGGTYEKEVAVVADGVCGLYIPYSTVDYSFLKNIPDPATAISANPSLYYGFDWTYKSYNGTDFIGAHQVDYYKQSRNLGTGRFMHPWGSQIEDTTYREFALVSQCKYFASPVCNRTYVWSETVAGDLSAADSFDRKWYILITPTIFSSGLQNVFHFKPIARKITADDIEPGSNMSFLIGKYLVWHPNRPDPTLVSEEPLESGWSESPGEAGYSKIDPCFLTVANTPVVGQSLTRQHFVNVSGVSGASSHIVTDASFRYSNGFATATFKSSGGTTLWDQPDDTPFDVWNVASWLGPFGGTGAKFQFNQYTYKLWDGSSSYVYPTDVQLAIVKYEYSKNDRGYKATGFALNWTDMPVTATSTFDSGSLGYYRLHTLDVTPAMLGITHPEDCSVEYRYAMRLKSPDPAVGYQAAIGYIGPQPFAAQNRGTLPYSYAVQPFEPINPIGLESSSMSATSLKGYYRPELKKSTETTSSIYQSNGESLGTFTSTGSPANNNFEFTISNLKLHFNVYHDDYGNKFCTSLDSDHQHHICVIRKKDGKFYTISGVSTLGNSLWRKADGQWATSQNGTYTTYVDSTGATQYQTSFNNWKIYDQLKDSEFYIIVADMVPTSSLRARGYTYFKKIIVLRKWLVHLDGTVEEIFNVSTHGMID